MSQQVFTRRRDRAITPSAAVQTRSASLSAKQGTAGGIFRLQRALGNQHVTRLIENKRIADDGAIAGIQRKVTVGAAHDPYEHEADRVAQHVVSMPDAHVQRQALSITSGKHKALMRRTEKASESVDLSPDVQTTLARSKGQGRPLPEPVRAFMEPRFGVDFSDVRVHTESDAIQMSRAVGAQAFTHGADVFYGAGHGPGDLLLTAHELTHVVQQTGGRPPDRAPLQRSPMARAVSRAVQPVVQRYAESVPVRGMGSGVGASTVKIGPLFGALNPTTAQGASTPTYLPFDRTLETVTLAEDVIGGTVSMNIFESADINNLTFNDTQWTSWKGIIPFTVSGDQVTFGAALQQAESGGTGATFSANVGSGATPGGGYVTIGVSVGASGSMTLGGGVGVGPVSASAPATGTSNYTGGLLRTFTVNVRPTPPKPIPGPDISFKVGLAKLAEGQEAVISKWFEGLPDATKDMIRNGRRTISISGYASTTGRKSHNRDLSESRAHVVERILRGHAGTNASLNIFFLGEDNATTPDEKEDPKWRRATFVVQAPNKAAPGVPGPAAPSGTP